MTEQIRLFGMQLPDPGSVLRWWREGLRDCLPARLRQGLTGRRRRVLQMQGDAFVLQVDSAQGVKEIARFASLQSLSLDAAAGGLSGARKAPLVLQVPPETVFRRNVDLPLAAAGNLLQVLRFEMDRLTPFAAGDVLFDFRVVSRRPEAGQVRVELAVVPRAPIEPVLVRLKAQGQAVGQLAAPGLWSGANLLRSETGGGARAVRHTGWFALLLVLALLAAVLVTPLWQARAVVIAIDERLQQAREEAAMVSRLQRQLEEEAQQAGFVLARQGEQTPVVEVLRELTERLPDDTWLQQLSVRGSDVSLQGESSQATQLVELLEDSPLFGTVALRAPLTQVRDAGTERFSIAMTLTPEEAP